MCKVFIFLFENANANQALVDYKRRFLDIEIGWPGSVADSRVFDNSYLSRTYEDVLAELGTTLLPTGDDGVEENIPAFILGDSAYRNSRHLVTTYKVSECDANRSVRHLNYQLSKARYHVENAFGLLKGRFQIFEKPLRSAAEDLPFAVHLIAGICTLHNFLIDVHDKVREGEVPPEEIDERLHELERLAREEEENEEIVPEQAENGVTRQALLRHVRWLDGEE
jgi:hypothetical protein